MKYYRYLYLSDSIKHPEILKNKLKLNMGVAGYYLICMSENYNQLEIIASYYFKMPYYRKHPYAVIGIAKSYEEAVSIIIDITNESLNKTDSANLIEYLKLKAKTRNFTIDIC